MNNNPLIWLSSQVISQSAAVHETNLNTLELPTWVYYPVGFEQAADESLPVLIFLHGTGPQGQPTEAGLNDLLTRDGTTPTTEINNNNYPHNIVTFSPYKQTGDWDNATIAGFIQSILDNVKMFKIDSTRIFLAGLSLGSIGISQYIFLQSETSINYVTIKGVFLAAGGSSGVGAPQAQDAIDKNILIRGWLGSNEPNGFATVMTSNESQTNALQANYYELNIVPGGGHNNSTWGVPFGNHAAGSIYDNVETSTSTNIIPTNIIEEYATRRYRFSDALQQDGTTPAEIGDAVYEFVDIGRFARSNLVWDGTGTPPLRTATHVEIGVGSDIEYFNLLLASLAQPTSLWIVMENLAGNDFNVFCNSLGAIVQGNGSNIRLNAGTVATFSGGKPPDGQTSILQFNISGSSSEYFLNNVASGSNPLNAGTNKTTLIRIGNSSTSANWRFKEMFFTPLVNNEIANQIYSDLESTYLTSGSMILMM